MLTRNRAVIVASLFTSASFCAEVRDVSVKVVADEEFRENRQWRQKVEEIAHLTSAEFEKHFAINFSVRRYGTWKPDATLRSLEALMDDLDLRVDKEECDILLAFTGRPTLVDSFRGMSRFQPGVVILKDGPEILKMVKGVEHEMAHIFGAVHLEDRDSLMDILSRGQVFDPVTSELITLNRSRSFDGAQFPTARENWPRAMQIYERVSSSITRLSKTRLDLEQMTMPPRRHSPRGVAWPKTDRCNDPSDVCLLLAQMYLETKMYEEALTECRKALSFDPDNIEAKDLAGIAHRRKGEIDEAIAVYKEILDTSPEHPRVWYNLGNCYLDRNQFAEAKRSFLKAVEINNNFAEANASLGYCYLLDGQTDEAIEKISRSHQLGFQSAKTRLNLCSAFLKKGMVEQALAEGRRAIELDPKLAMAYNTLGIAYTQKGQTQDAIDQFKKSIEIDPKDEDAHLNLGNVYLSAGNYELAMDSYLTALKLGAESGMLHNNIAVIYFKKADYARAWEHAQSARSLGFAVHPQFLEELSKTRAERHE